MFKHNLGTVIGFELVRTVTKKRFWIGTLSVPVVMAIVFLLIFASNSATSNTAAAQKDAKFTISYTDASGLITAADAELFNAKPAESVRSGIQAVQSGKVDAFFAYPADPVSQTVEVYGADRGLFENNKYPAVAHALLKQSVKAMIASPQLASLAEMRPRTVTTTYVGSVESGGLNSVIPPLLFVVIFYGLVMLLAGQMLSSTLEEKENRVTEMILTTLNPTTLISGKVIALFAIGLTQAIVFLSPVAIGLAFFREQLSFPDFELSSLIFDPGRMTIGALILVGGFALFTTTLFAIGAVMPTAKEAGTFMGVMMAFIFIPVYIVTLIISAPQALIVQIFTYFPFSAPVTALLRNGFGSLGTVEAYIVIAILYVSSALMFRLAVRLFQYGSVSYNSKVSIRKALGTRPAMASTNT